MRRRDFLKIVPVLGFGEIHAAKVSYPDVRPRSLAFPRDHGAHPDYRVEWWYVTGWLDDALGFQVTFFRARPEEESDNPSSFNPKQVLFAHAALSDPKRGRLLHDQRAARAGLSLAHVGSDRTEVWIDDWSLVQDGKRYNTKIVARDFEYDLSFFADEIVLQGEDGLSRKGHRPAEASHYDSRPNLHVIGTVNGRGVAGSGWLDHEWSSAYLAPEAVGWDWCGVNLQNHQSLMAFRMRNKDGGVHFADPGVTFEPLRLWKSPRTGVEYPVEMRVRTFRHDLILKPLMDDQELDSRQSTGTIYWEGAVSAYQKNNLVGKGYLELTGYWKPMKL